jgi:dihydrofolate synthase/folylpolyglutamate synthase
VTVITSISFDHTKQLGNTLAEIAGEKAGIIKPGVPVVSGVVDAEPRDVVRRVACEHGCRLVELGRDFDVAYHPPADARLPHAAPKIDFVSRLPGHTVRNDGLSLGLLGRHQAANAAVALQVIEELRRQQWSISDEAVRRGLAAARLPARVELVARSPAVVIDGAHNVASVEALLATLDESFPVARRTLLFATTRDKDVAGMLARLLPRFDRVVLTRYENNPRGVPVDELWALAQGLAAGEAQAGRASIEPDPAAAWRAVWPAASGDELICVAGSLFIAAEMRRLALASTGVEALRSTAVSAAEEDFLAGNPATRSN